MCVCARAWVRVCVCVYCVLCYAGVWVMLTLMPTLLLNRSRFNPALNIRDYIGWGLWAAGFLLEAVADDQKRRYDNCAAMNAWV